MREVSVPRTKEKKYQSTGLWSASSIIMALVIVYTAFNTTYFTSTPRVLDNVCSHKNLILENNILGVGNSFDKAISLCNYIIIVFSFNLESQEVLSREVD